MMLRYLVITWCLFWNTCHATEVVPPPLSVEYDVAIRRSEKATFLHVEVSFPGNTSGLTQISIPTEWGGATGAERGIHNLRLLVPAAQLSEGESPNLKKISHEPDAQLRIAYDLVPIQIPDSDSAPGQHYLPEIDDSHVHLIGWTSWVFPFISKRQGLTARLRIIDLPPNWSIATSFGVGQSAYTFPWQRMDFLRSIVVMGDYRVISLPIGDTGSQLRFAVRGQWPTTDVVSSERLQRMVQGLSSFWQDATHDYLVVLSPLPLHKRQSRQGTALLNGFVSLASGDTSLHQVETVWMHETLHRWVPSGVSLDDYWFREGFTDYYTYYLRTGLGLASVDEFASAFNLALAGVADPSMRELNNAAIAKQFHTNVKVRRLPYWRGMLLAAHWDSAIRVNSKGKYTLGDAIRSLRREVNGSPTSSESIRMRLEIAMQNHGVPNAPRDIDTYIIQGKRLRPDVSAFAPCLENTARSEDSKFQEVDFRIRVADVRACAAIFGR